MKPLRRVHGARPWERLFVVAGAVVLTAIFFLVLPLIQAISASAQPDLVLQKVETAAPPPPPPPPEPEPEKEEEPEEPPPQLDRPNQPLDLSQLELALNPHVGGGWSAGDFRIDLEAVAGEAGGDGMFSLADLDQKPRAIYQPGPVLTPQVRQKAPGTVFVLFVVDPEGRVENPIVQQSSDPAFERPALDAIRKWKFEPGKRNGKPVRSRMRQQFTFPQG